MELTKLQKLGVEKKLIEIDLEKNIIVYKNLRNGDKKYKFSDPEEQVRSEYFVDLVIKYQYEPENIDLEVEMPKRVPNQFADLVIFDDGVDNKYFVIEFKRSDITDNEFEQAVKQGIGNGRVLKAKYYGTIAGTTMRFFEENKDESIDDAFYSIPVKYGNPETWKYTKGGTVDLEPVTMENLKTALDKAQQTIWHGGKRNPVEAFGEVAKLIFIKIADEKELRKIGEPYQFQRKRNESTKKLQLRINEIYEKERKRDKQVFSEEIKLNDKELSAVVEHLQNLNFNKTDLDIKGEAFQNFLGNFFKGDAGQYFTPNPVTRFCLDLYAPEMQNTDKVLDTSCGSGGFLLKALDIMREQANEYFDKDSTEHFRHWHSFAENNLFGIEISEGIARVAKMNMILHDDGHTNVISHDGLDDIEKMTKINLGFKKNSFKYIFTNPPFGSVIKKTESDYLDNFELGKNGSKTRPTQKTEILFLERIHDFLQEGGKAVVVLPDGILTNSSLQYVREWILEHFKLVGVISLTQDAFKYFGAGVKSSILVLEKNKNPEPDYKIFMATAENIGIDANGRECKNDLDGILRDFRAFKKDNKINSNSLCNLVSLNEIKFKNRFDVYYFLPKFYFYEQEIKKQKHIILDDCLSFIGTGKTPEKKIYVDNINEGTGIIKAGSNNGKENINLDKLDFVKKGFKGTKAKQFDIFILASAHQASYVGKKIYFLEEELFNETFFVGELLCIRANQEKNNDKEICNPLYLHNILNSKYIKELINREKRGQTSHIYAKDIKNIIIPFPNIEEQNKIAKLIKSNLNEIKKLEKNIDFLYEEKNDSIEKIFFNF